MVHLYQEALALCLDLIQINDSRVAFVTGWDACRVAGLLTQLPEVRMLPMQMDRAASRDITPRGKPLEWLGGVLLLTSLGVATISWCVLLAMALWKVAYWIVDQAA